MTNFIYIGGAPKNGKCQVKPISGIATVTNFNISQVGWEDQIPITQYEYLYSYDDGQLYLPIETETFIEDSILYTFSPIYNKYQEIRIMCRATNNKGFSSYSTTKITLEKKSNADATKDLNSVNPLLASSEIDIL